MRSIPIILVVAGVFTLASHGTLADDGAEYSNVGNEDFLETENALLGLNWTRGPWTLSANYAELEWIPAPAPGMRDTTATVRAKAIYRIGASLGLAISGFHSRYADDAGRSAKGAGGLLQLHFKM